MYVYVYMYIIYSHIGLHMCACLRDIHTDLLMNGRMSVFLYMYSCSYICVGAMCVRVCGTS